MQNDKICSDIVSALVSTKEEVNLLLNEVDVLLRSIYVIGPGDFEDTMQRGIRAKTASILSQFINSSNCEEFLKDLKKHLNSINYLGLTIAFEPNLEIIKRLNLWVKQNLGQGIAMDITVNKSILGGAIIEYKGKIGDFTILPKIDNYFLNTNVNI